MLDLFAGTGSYGLEAISRGAKAADFVEKNHRIVVTLKKISKRLSTVPDSNQVWAGYTREMCWNF